MGNDAVAATVHNVARYVHTLRYLKPIQVLGRLWLLFPRRSLSASPPPPLQRDVNVKVWQQPPLQSPSLLAPARFRFLNEEHELLSPTDWNNSNREKLWLYNLHYFDDLNAEGAAERQAWHEAMIRRWVAENTPGRGNGWEPYPLARRIVNWVKWAWVGNELPPGAAQSLALQARWLRRHLEWHLLGNHLLADAKALIFAGLFFEGREAEGWLAKGIDIFSRQLAEQVLTDGGHFERSPMYHAQVLEDLLDVINALRVFPHGTGDIGTATRAALRERCGDAARRMLGWLKVMTHPDGGIALLNDSAFGVAAETAALVDYVAGLSLPQLQSLDSAPAFTGVARQNDDHHDFSTSSESIKFTHLESSGYIRVDSGEMSAFLDVAPIGPDYLPGHAHADTLSFELSLGQQRVIVDSGVSQYGTGTERARQRGTAAHNTVQIDGQDSSEVWGGFRVARRAYPRDLRVSTEHGTVSCAHDGYRRLPGRPFHRREWRFRENGLRIRDTIEGDFGEATGRLHFHPGVQVIPSCEGSGTSPGHTCDAGSVLLPDGRRMRWRIEKGRGRLLETTWHSEFGRSILNQCLEIHFTDRETEITISWLPKPIE